MPEKASQQLLDTLSEALAVELDGLRIYTEFLADAPDELQAKIEEYGEHARRSAMILEMAITDLGGDPGYVAPAAEAATQLTDAVLAATEGFLPRAWIARLQHVLAYEMRDQLLWQALDALGAQEHGRNGEILREATDAVLTGPAGGAHMHDRNDERREWAQESIRVGLARELGLPDPHTWAARSVGR